MADQGNKFEVDFEVDCSVDSRKSTNKIDKQDLDKLRRLYEDFLKNGKLEKGLQEVTE